MAGRAYTKRWTPEHATQLLDAADRSGLSDRGFAKRRGVDAQRLWWWRKRLGRQKAAAQSDAKFVELAVRSPAGTVATSRVEILLSNGRVVATPVDVEPGALARLLDAVEGRQC